MNCSLKTFFAVLLFASLIPTAQADNNAHCFANTIVGAVPININNGRMINELNGIELAHVERVSPTEFLLITGENSIAYSITPTENGFNVSRVGSNDIYMICFNEKTTRDAR